MGVCCCWPCVRGGLGAACARTGQLTFFFRLRPNPPHSPPGAAFLPVRFEMGPPHQTKGGGHSERRGGGVQHQASPEFVALRGERAEWGPLTRGAGFAGSASGKRRQTPEPKRFKIKMGVRQAGGDAHLVPAVAECNTLLRHFSRFPAYGRIYFSKTGESGPIKKLMPQLA